jgi:uncharacterized protein
MARNKKSRIIQKAPHFDGFKPFGLPSKKGAEVVIHYEEYEALILCDYELLTQAEAAITMNVSRPTFTRIYESARRKIAKAFMEGCAIRFEGGKANVTSWYRCEECGISFTTEGSNPVCPFCLKSLTTTNQ